MSKYYSNVPDNLLIHELVHVWQGQNNGLTGLGYKLDSAIHQILPGNAYHFDERLMGRFGWGMFNAEQQAEIVESWFRKGTNPNKRGPTWGNERRSDIRFRYVHWVIRKRWFGGWAPPPPAP